jgi:ribosome production factor 2
VAEKYFSFYFFMLKRKPKTAAGHRAQKKKEPQAEEGAKKAVFLKGTSTSLIVSTTLKELVH